MGFGGWWNSPQAKPSRSPYVLLDSESPGLPSSTPDWRRGSRCTRASPAPPALMLPQCLSSLPPNLACSLSPHFRAHVPCPSPLTGHWGQGGREQAARHPGGCAWGCPLGHRSDLLLSALVRGFCFSTHQGPPLHAIVGTRWHCHPPSPGACTSLWPPGHFWLHSLLVPQLQGSPGSVHVTRTPVSSLSVPPVPVWRGASGQGRVPAATSGDQGWMQALEQLPGEVPCASSWAGPAHEPWAFLPGGQHRSAWGWAGPSVSLTARAPWLRLELPDLVAAGKRLLGGMCCERLGAVLWGPRAQGQVVEEVSEGGPRVPASSDPSYLPLPEDLGEPCRLALAWTLLSGSF